MTQQQINYPEYCEFHWNDYTMLVLMGLSFAFLYGAGSELDKNGE
jgi:hypothetical protein